MISAQTGEPAVETGLLQDASSAYRLIAAWVVLFVVLWLLNKTAVGHSVLYYLGVMCLLTLLLTNYTALAAVLKPISTPLNTNGAPGGPVTTN